MTFCALSAQSIAEHFQRKRYLCFCHLFSVIVDSSEPPIKEGSFCNANYNPGAHLKDEPFSFLPASNPSSRTVWSRWTRSWYRWKAQPKGATLRWMQKQSSVLWWTCWIKSELPLNAKSALRLDNVELSVASSLTSVTLKWFISLICTPSFVKISAHGTGDIGTVGGIHFQNNSLSCIPEVTRDSPWCLLKISNLTATSSDGKYSDSCQNSSLGLKQCR